MYGCRVVQKALEVLDVEAQVRVTDLNCIPCLITYSHQLMPRTAPPS